MVCLGKLKSSDILEEIITPAYVCELEKLNKNLERLGYIQKSADIKILLALKAFSMWRLFPKLKSFLAGCSASGLYEARLAHEEFKKEVHTYSPAFKVQDMDEIISYSDKIIFNTIGQFEKFKDQCLNKSNLELGLRVNPESSEIETELYDPCSKYSRLGVRFKDFPECLPKEISGLHLHNHFEQDSYVFERNLKNFEAKFQKYLKQIQWINFGGGHHFNHVDYDVEHFITLIKNFKSRYDLQVYFEPGSAVVWQAGYLAACVIDIIPNETPVLIMDASFETHMPDCLAMPYRPELRASSFESSTEKTHKYYVGGPSCLAGDYLGPYYFSDKIELNDSLLFEDMLHYTLVKNTQFNGVPLPNVYLLDSTGQYELIKKFDYENYKGIQS